MSWLLIALGALVTIKDSVQPKNKYTLSPQYYAIKKQCDEDIERALREYEESKKQFIKDIQEINNRYK